MTMEEAAMIAVMGATGKTGGAAATKLLASGKKIRVIGRSEERLRKLRERGAETAVGDALDAAFLTSAFRGAKAVYAMAPADVTQPDIRSYYGRFGETIGQAVKSAGVKQVVFLSSIGAELPGGTGPIAGLHDVEERFKTLGVDVLFLRPGYFFENLYGSLPLIKHQGINGAAMEPDVPVVMTATRDIGAAAADELARGEFRGTSVRELLAPRDYTMAGVTKILGAKIGKPDLKYVRFPDADFAEALVKMGFSRGMAAAFVEMANAFNAGKLRPLEGRNKGTTMPTPFETVADELAAAYRAM
jgi:uncharacterized protein YbjT (DUF2867 family)